VVDDEWICRELAQELLRDCGLTVTSAASGVEALACLESGSYDLVLMDLQMPEMSGVETARAIRANPATKNLPIVAMTADSFAGESERLAETGMDDAIDKPIDAGSIGRVVDRWLRS
jgi:CheY-like chemotaxis protein